jgi:hypothetical protein
LNLGFLGSLGLSEIIFFYSLIRIFLNDAGLTNIFYNRSSLFCFDLSNKSVKNEALLCSILAEAVGKYPILAWIFVLYQRNATFWGVEFAYFL